ncbi:YqiA/YcfP family alpha/beta fold hydrolase [Candidatus Colwellia aromaticivorans]|uniref:YqiA/YcfP family alpha/beta fold hydrolase n=1 Tax=Candidatus Colwellia aromaticivorans TaxID=2267621 RepID=UPI000DF2F3D4|nr:YqiA/YcfP family alpha/beta fold hydrolase [Candidatus Colwellia aromaticivorans]
MQKNILYIHGFNSSPLSVKAEQARQYFFNNFPQVHFYCPQVASNPKEAIDQLEHIIQSSQTKGLWYLMGSSLGGYFASHLSEKYNFPCVLINPAIKPFELLQDYLGEQVNPYTEEVYQVTTEHMTELKVIEPKPPSFDMQQKNNYLVMVQTDDEVLNYQEAVKKYQHCRLVVEEGGDHSFVDFEQHLPVIADFFNLTVFNTAKNIQ